MAADAATPMGGGELLDRLHAIVRQRIESGDPQASYVARLHAKGLDAILKKIGEEATEVVMAAKDAAPDRVVAEVADLWFHCLIALAAQGRGPVDVLAELARREGMSGLEEFALRRVQAREREDQR